LLAQRCLTNRFKLEFPRQFPARFVVHRTPPQVSILRCPSNVGTFNSARSGYTPNCIQAAVCLLEGPSRLRSHRPSTRWPPDRSPSNPRWLESRESLGLLGQSTIGHASGV